jgi:Fibronectin type III domain
MVKTIPKGFLAALAAFAFILPAHAPAQGTEESVPETLVFTQTSGQDTVQLTWSPNKERNIAGYRLYYGTRSHSYSVHVNVGMSTIATLTNLTGRHFFAVTAYNTLGLESPFSNEVSWP